VLLNLTTSFSEAYYRLNTGEEVVGCQKVQMVVADNSRSVRWLRLRADSLSRIAEGVPLHFREIAHRPWFWSSKHSPDFRLFVALEERQTGSAAGFNAKTFG